MIDRHSPCSLRVALRGRLRIWPVVFTAALGGCLNPAPATEVDPDGPVLLRPAATTLEGSPLDQIVMYAKQTTAPDDLPLTARSVRDLAATTGAAVVSLYVATSEPYEFRLSPVRMPWGGLQLSLPGGGLGSAFFIHADGYLITNDHVIHRSDRIVARLLNGDDYEVEVVARDPVYDLALLRVVDRDRQFPTLAMGDARQVVPGEPVMAIGNPLGLGHTVTTGIISQTDRRLKGLQIVPGEPGQKPPNEDEQGRHIQFLQTDTAINPGSSGGPLVTMTGAWIGVNSAGVTQAQNLAFAVPSYQVVEFLERVLAADGEREPRPTR